MTGPFLTTQTSYDQVAHEYAEKFKDEMDDKPFDRDWLDRLVRQVEGLGPICDMGCGPGQIARYLHRWWDKPVSLDFTFYQTSEMEDWLHQAGYELEGSLVREPNPDVEVATERAYIFAKKPL